MTEVKLNESIELPSVKKYNNAPRKKFNKELRAPRPRVKTPEELKEQVSTALSNVGGKYVRFDNIDHTEGLLFAGVNLPSDDSSTSTPIPCFAVLNRDRRVEYVNNNEHFSVQHGVSANLYVLDYLLQREPVTLLNIVDSAFERDNVEPFTKVYINAVKPRPNNKKSNNKNFKKNNKKS